MSTQLIVMILSTSSAASSVMAKLGFKRESQISAAVTLLALSYGAFFRPEVIVESIRREAATLEAEMKPVFDAMIARATPPTTTTIAE